MKNTVYFLVFMLITLFSCKKEANVVPKIKLETFSNINFNTVFDGVDTSLENKDSIVQKINSYYSGIWEGNNLWGGFLVAKGDEILFEKYRGFAKGENLEPINQNTPLHIASISKTLTAMATMKLIESGILKLDDSIAQILPQFPYPNVTIKNLLTQRSGLPKYEYFIENIKPQPKELSKKYITNQDILNMMIRYKPPVSRLPNIGFEYCNSNFAILALVIEKVTQRSFPEVMKTMVFDPLKMKNTYIFQEKDEQKAAKSFYQRGPKQHPLDRLDLIYGDKNVYTTPRDLFQFSKAMYAKNFLRKDLMDMVFQPYSNEKQGMNNYGIGFRMKIFDNGEKLTYHTGWWHGSNTLFVHLLKSNVTIIALGNKFSRSVYSASSLSGLFEDFPLEVEKFQKTMAEKDSLSAINDSSQNIDE